MKINEKTYILFDLDGTLTDSADGITNSVAHSLRRFGLEVPDRSQLNKFVGPPLAGAYMKYCGFDRDKATLAVEYYREYYREKGIFENSVYDGIPELLGELVKCGKKLVVATSKPAIFSEKILCHFSLDKYFVFLSGSELDGTRVKKDEVIKYALDNAHISPDDAVMIGDRSHDIEGAKANGLPSVGVLYGYGDRAEHESAGADFIAESVSELRGILLG
nr:HAD family hydrolase [Clostridia bacterium]